MQRYSENSVRLPQASRGLLLCSAAVGLVTLLLRDALAVAVRVLRDAVLLLRVDGFFAVVAAR